MLEKLIDKIKNNKIKSIKDIEFENLNEIKLFSEAVKGNNSLKRIALNENAIGVEGVKYIADSISVNSSLTEIDLSFNQINVEGTKYLSESLKRNSTLTKINLLHNEIGDEGAMELAEMLKINNTLTKIGLVSNKITDKGAESLIKALNVNYFITEINLVNNNISEDNLSKINKYIERNKQIAKDIVKLEARDRKIFTKGLSKKGIYSQVNQGRFEMLPNEIIKKINDEIKYTHKEALDSRRKKVLAEKNNNAKAK